MNHPLGILRSGPCAFVDERGTVAPSNADWTLRWWVAGEDRWHRPDVDAAVRERLIEDTPVVETAVRVPGGDAIGVAYAHASAGRPALAGRVANASPVPVAVAIIVGPATSIVVADSTIIVDGRDVIRLSRRPSATESAAGLDELLRRLPETSTMNRELTGYAAVVVPLPHTQAVSWQVLDTSETPASVPDPDQVVAGWIRHSEEGAQLSLPATEATAFARGRHLVALGVAPGASIVEVADHVAAAVRLGWFDAALDGTERLAIAQGGRGRIGDDESSTVAALDALASWRRAGIPFEGLEHLVGPVVSAARWLTRRLERLDGSERSAADDAIRGAAAFLSFMDQPAISKHLYAVTGDASEASHSTGSGASPRAVSGLIDALVTDDVGGLRLLDGWSVAWARAPIEASAVPTPWGTMSFALRWHGSRPALLWEVEPWIEVHRSEPSLRSVALDPSWQGSGWRGEALLAEAVLPTPVDESFS